MDHSIVTAIRSLPSLVSSCTLASLLLSCGSTTRVAESPTSQASEAIETSQSDEAKSQPSPATGEASNGAHEEAAAPATHETDPASDDMTAEDSAEATAQGLPGQCAETGERCVPPPDFVNRLCRDKFPGVAIAMFEKRTPWTRLYVRMVEIDSVNTTGGPAGDAKLVFGEELLLLREHGTDRGGMQVSGTGGFLVLRWDGTCATVASDEVVSHQPGFPKTAPIVWKYIDSELRTALLADKQVKTASRYYQDHCRGMRPGTEKGQCKHWNQILNDSIVLALRKGIDLPDPGRIP